MAAGETVHRERPKTDAKGRFVKGHKGGPGRGKKFAHPQIGEDMARDMQLAYTTAEKPDDPPGVKQARNLLHRDYERFLTLYARVAPVVQKVASDATPPPDVITVGDKERKVEGMIEDLLSRWEASDGKASETARA